jgi:hypothetical protein
MGGQRGRLEAATDIGVCRKLVQGIEVAFCERLKE